MAQYNITLSDGVTIIPIPDGSTTFSAADIPLVGQNTQLYGSPVATAFLYHLENFANTTAPSVNTLTGQLWYDTTDLALPARGTLNVYNGSTFDPIANTGVGTIESATLRWNDTNKTYQEEERIRISDAGELLIALDGTASNVVTIQHDGTDLNIVGTAGTTDIDVTGVTAVNLPSLTLVTVLDETYGGTGVITYATGDILVATGVDTLAVLGVGSNDDVLTLVAGEPAWVATGAGVTDLDSLTDVTASGAGTEGMLYKSGADWLVTTPAELGWDNGNQDLTVANINAIAAADLIDRSSPGTLTATTFSGNITAQANILLGDDDKIIFGTGSDVAIDFDSPNFDIVAASATDLNITGFGGNVVSGSPVHATSGGAESFRALGDANTWAATDSYISFYDDDGSDHGLQIGTLAADGTTSRINSRLGPLHLYSSNTLTLEIGNNASTWTQNSITALALRNAFLTGANATSSATVADHNDNQHNVGYNETPDGNLDVGANLTVGSFTLGNVSIGKLLNRNTGTSRSITLDSTGISGDIPIGGSVLILNSQSGGTMTIIPGGSDTLTWIDGSGTTPASATRTLDNNSICTVRKNTLTNWQIWGNGLS